MKPLILTYKPQNEKIGIEMSMFCRGAATADSNKLDWSYNPDKDEMRIFVADEHVYETLQCHFGAPDSSK